MSRRRKLTRTRLNVERLEERMMLAGDAGWLHHVTQPLDVNGDGQLTRDDVLMVVSALRRQRLQGVTGGADYGYVDVNHDRQLTAMDAQMVIGRLRRGFDDQLLPDAPRTIDGTQNNPFNSLWGSAGIELLRDTSTHYADGYAAPAVDNRPSPREISNLVVAQTHLIENDRNLTDMVWQWGQFLDHDLDLTEVADPAEPMPIQVHATDLIFDPLGTGAQSIAFNRSTYNHLTGDATNNPRQQINAITAFIDGSNVYGSDAQRAAALRTFSGGRLQTSDGDLLPFNTGGLPNAGGTSDSLFLAGDIRANEQVALTAMHTLFVREHNRLADEIAAQDPQLSDEQIYQRARSIVSAHLQAITYNEFLPALLGEGALGPYTGYNDTVQPGISNLFSTAAFRLGHSLLSPTLLRLNNDGSEIAAGNLSLQRAFFTPQEIIQQGIDSILKGLITQRAQEFDAMIVDDVRNFLFGPPGAGGFDLAALNIQRGRDHGLPDYNQTRVDLGLQPVATFADIASDPALQAALATAYDGNVNQIDVWVGALAEDHLPGSSVGELIYTVLVDQFQRLRAGDCYWYQRMFSGTELQEIEQTTLADIIQRNTSLTHLPRNVFLAS